MLPHLVALLVLIVSACSAAPTAVVPGCDAGCSVGPLPGRGNMNGEYTIANGVPPTPGGKAFSTNSSEYEGGVEYFDVYSPMLQTRYSQVYWTMMPPVALPPAIVQRFAGQVMAITGWESDQVIRGVNGAPDMSIPITWAYNHHYGAYVNGRDSVLAEVELKSHNDPNGFMGHAHPGDTVWTTLTPRRSDRNAASGVPAATVFATGNGGEYRKSFHSYPAPYAQLVESPVSWAIQPMQIDTWNRDGSMSHPSQPFTPGPYPTSAQAPRTGADAVYSGLLECPCTDRITRAVGPSSGATAKVDGSCAAAQVATPAVCKALASSLAQTVRPPPPTAPGTACTYAEQAGTYLAGMAPDAPTAGWPSLAPAQQWCCEHPGGPGVPGCGGITLQGGVYTARAGGTPTRNPLAGLSSWVRGGPAGDHFTFSSGTSDALPAGCSMTIVNATHATVAGFFNTNVASPALCGGKVGARLVAGAGSAGNVSLDLSMQEALNEVTITLSGPDKVWFGVGFDASGMTTEPYAIVVDGDGNVSEHKLGVHAAGTVLQPTVSVVSSASSAGRRIVVLTRKMKISDYEDAFFGFDITQTALPYITAIGSGPAFAYHRSHAVGNLALFARQPGAATCVCAGAPPAFGDTADGTLSYDAVGTDGANSTVGFGKRCVGECPAGEGSCSRSSSMLEQRNPTCDVRTYSGGLGCCHHLYYLLDKNQSGLIPPSVLAYHMKMRVYYQPYDPARHQQLYRWHWQTAMGSGEYDVPKCAAGTPPDQCVHKITANIRVSDFANGACDPRSGLNVLTPACKNGSIGFKPIFLGGHCHAPTCLSMELYNNDTGELLCRNVPTYGTLSANATGPRRFEEKGYLALPPCIWGDPAQGLPAPPLLTWATNLRAVKTANATYGHTGEMARWQGHGVIV